MLTRLSVSAEPQLDCIRQIMTASVISRRAACSRPYVRSIQTNSKGHNVTTQRPKADYIPCDLFADEYENPSFHNQGTT